MREHIKTISVQVIVVGTIVAPISALQDGRWSSLLLAPMCWVLGAGTYRAAGGRL